MSVREGMTLEEIAKLTGGRVEGDPEVRVTRPAPLGSAEASEMGMVAEERYLAGVGASRAGSFLVTASLVERLEDGRPRVVVEDARAALVPILERLDPTPRPEPGVHPTAVLGPGVTLEDEVSVGPYTVLERDVRVGKGTVVGAHCVLGAGSRVGEACYLHPQVVLYGGTVLGDRVIVHSGARLGSDGFGYTVRDGRYVKIPQVGGCVVEDDVEVGANTCMDRGSIGDTVVGRGTKLDNLVHLAHNVRVGQNVALAGMVGIAGSTTIGDWAQFGGQSGASGHLTIGDGARISAQAGVIGDLEDQARVTGFPARDQQEQLKTWAAARKLPDSMKRLRALMREVEALKARLEGEEG